MDKRDEAFMDEFWTNLLNEYEAVCDEINAGKPTCSICDRHLEDTEFKVCSRCADETDYFENRFDMETVAEYNERVGK